MSQTALAILQRPRGTVRLAPRADGVDIYVREETINFCKYPNPCPGDVRLGRWTVGAATVVYLLVCMDRKPMFTFQSVLNLTNTRDNQILNAMATRGALMVHIVSRDNERSIRLANVVHRDATAVLEFLRDSESGWTSEQFDEACRQLDLQYPTAYAMYRELCR